MRTRSIVLSLVTAAVVAPLVAGCASDKREWMKVGQPYTAQEFRQDYADCTKGRKLDEDCMRGRGWVDVSASASGKATPAPDTSYRRPPGR